MELPLTVAVAAAFLIVAVACGWLGARPPNPHRGPRLAPWRFLMMMAATGFLLMSVHIVNLLGVTTGH